MHHSASKADHTCKLLPLHAVLLLLHLRNVDPTNYSVRTVGRSNAIGASSWFMICKAASCVRMVSCISLWRMHAMLADKPEAQSVSRQQDAAGWRLAMRPVCCVNGTSVMDPAHYADIANGGMLYNVRGCAPQRAWKPKLRHRFDSKEWAGQSRQAPDVALCIGRSAFPHSWQQAAALATGQRRRLMPSCSRHAPYFLLEDLALDVLQAVNRRLLSDHVLDPLLLGLQHTDYLGSGAVHSSFRAIRSNNSRATAG